MLFAGEVATNTTEVLKRLKYAGAEGCEIGQRFFGVEKRDELVSALSENNIELSGMHCNGLKLVDLIHDPAKAENALMEVAELVATMPNKNIIATGGASEMEAIREAKLGQGLPEPELHDPEQVKVLAHNLNDIVRRVKERTGAQVYYHNHSWEFADNGLIWFTLAEEAPDLMFALDTGWVVVSGFDPVELIQKYPGRFHYVHLRDLKKPADSSNLPFKEAHTSYIDLGTGDMNYPNLMRQLNKVMDENDWAIVEYELGDFDAQSYTKAISYLRGIRDML